jgi:serine/threonine-protein kinase
MTTRYVTDASFQHGEPLPRTFLDRLGQQFVLEREIGRGGMASVWLAHRRSDNERLAIKVLRPMLAEILTTQRFLREVRIAGEVRSEALMPLAESGEIDGLPYYVMPFAEGGSLRDWLRRDRQLGIEDAVRVARAIATALSALHRSGFVHRDIKPENVLLSASGDIYVADYGIAHALTASAKGDDPTSAGLVVGTPPYMSPEQSVGDTVDGRSDIYSMGCVLYELLVGETPFHGATAQVMLARHLHEQPPSLQVVRPTVPAGLEQLVLRALAKVPADRFADADAFIAALDELGDMRDTASGWYRPRPGRRWRVSPVVLGVAAVVIAGAAIAGVLAVRQPPLDPNRVIVFPFASLGARPESSLGQLPMLVGSALDRTATAKWLDGFSMLDDRERAGTTGLTAARAKQLARRARARHYVDGTISRVNDSLAVQVRLYDAKTGLLLDSKTERGSGSTDIGELALRAVVRVLPKLTGLDQVVDVSGLTGHSPAAVDAWLRGERAYRQSRMPDALGYFESALSIDSLLVPAAFRAASASSWTAKPERASSYIRLALRHPEGLTPRQKPFALALESFLAGRASDAMIRLRPALDPETETADAWMLAGEVQLHLLPSVGVDSIARRVVPVPTTWPYESFAEEAFKRALVLDSAFAPPLVHLSEIAARRGDANAAARYARLLERTNTDSILVRRLDLMDRCLRGGANAVDWIGAARRSSVTLYHVGFYLRASSDRRARECGRAAFRARLVGDTTQAAERWGSLLGLHGMLAAEGRTDEALHLVDSALTTGLPSAVGLYVVDAVVGLPIGTRADAFVAELLKQIDTRGAPTLWLLTLWSARTNDSTTLVRVGRKLSERAASSGQRLDSLMARVASAYIARARADTALALRLFSELEPTADHRQVENSLWESLATERLAYAGLLLAHGDAAEAHRMASTFDHPHVLIHDLFLRPSLELRQRAARALGDATLERRATARLESLRSTIP